MDNARKKIIKSSVSESITRLIRAAFLAYRNNDLVRSKRYVKMALDLMKKHKVKLSPDLKNSFCKKCLLVWIPATTLTSIYDSKHNCIRIRCRCGYSKRV